MTDPAATQFSVRNIFVPLVEGDVEFAEVAGDLYTDSFDNTPWVSPPSLGAGPLLRCLRNAEDPSLPGRRLNVRLTVLSLCVSPRYESIVGRSATLALALADKMLRHRRRGPDQPIIATGEVAEDGRIGGLCDRHGTPSPALAAAYLAKFNAVADRPAGAILIHPVEGLTDEHHAILNTLASVHGVVTVGAHHLDELRVYWDAEPAASQTASPTAGAVFEPQDAAPPRRALFGGGRLSPARAGWLLGAAAFAAVLAAAGSDPTASLPPPNAALPPPPAATPPAVLEARVLAWDGGWRVVDPEQHRFLTNAHFRVQIDGSLPGVFAAINVASGGARTILGEGWISNGQRSIELPSQPNIDFSFTGAAGREVLLIKYWPCRSSDTDLAALPAAVSAALLPCSELQSSLTTTANEPQPEAIVLSERRVERNIVAKPATPEGQPMMARLVLRHVFPR